MPLVPPSRYGIQNEIEYIKQITDWYEKLEGRKKNLSDTLTNYVREALSMAGFSGICVSELRFDSKREPEITLHHYGFPYSGRYVGNRRFVVTESTSVSKVYSTEIVVRDLPFDGGKVLGLCEKLTEQLGVSVKFFETELVDVDSGVIAK